MQKAIVAAVGAFGVLLNQTIGFPIDFAVETINTAVTVLTAIGVYFVKNA